MYLINIKDKVYQCSIQDLKRLISLKDRWKIAHDNEAVNESELNDELECLEEQVVKRSKLIGILQYVT